MRASGVKTIWRTPAPAWTSSPVRYGSPVATSTVKVEMLDESELVTYTGRSEANDGPAKADPEVTTALMIRQNTPTKMPILPWRQNTVTSFFTIAPPFGD